MKHTQNSKAAIATAPMDLSSGRGYTNCHTFRFISVFLEEAQQYEEHVVNSRGAPVPLLTQFYRHSQQQGYKQAKEYVSTLFPYLTFIERHTEPGMLGEVWDSPPEAVRQSLEAYLRHQHQCIFVQTYKRKVVRTSSRGGVCLLTTLQALYRFAVENRYYWYEHPLAQYSW